MSFNKNDIFVVRVEEFCKKIAVSPVGKDDKINPDKAIFHTVTAIREAVGSVLQKEKRIGVTGTILLENLRYGVEILENKGRGVNSITYAITREGIRALFEVIDKKNKPHSSWKGSINLPVRSCGITSKSNSFHSGGSECS